MLRSYCMTVTQLTLGTGRRSSKNPWVSNVWPAPSLSVNNSFFLSTSIVFFMWSDIWFDFFELDIFIDPLCVPFFMYRFIDIWKQVLITACYHFFLLFSSFFGFFSAFSFPGIPVCPGIQQSSPVFFPVFIWFAMVCSFFRTFGLVRNWFWGACRHFSRLWI